MRPMSGQGRAALFGAGDRPCCSISGAGTGSPWGLEGGPGPWQGGGSHGQSWTGTVRAVGSLRTVTVQYCGLLLLQIHTCLTNRKDGIQSLSDDCWRRN